MRKLLSLPLAALALGALGAPASAATRDVDALAAARLRLTLGTPPTLALGPAAPLGDVNGDGRGDIAVGAPYSAPDPARRRSGRVFVVFGSLATGIAALADAGFQIVGGTNYDAGLAVAAAGDVNRDGRADVLLSAPRKGVAGYKTPGSAYVVFGKADRATIDLTRLTPAQGFEIVGVAQAPSATRDDVAGVGDLNRDGYADVVLTEGFYRKRGFDYRGGVAVVYGRRRSARVDLQRLGSRGFRIESAGVWNGGATVAGAGDVNGDGRPDLVLGVPSVKLPGRRFPANSVFVVFGGRPLGTLDLRHLGSRGFRIGGLRGGAVYGAGVTGVGDVNRDGRDDVAVVRDPGGLPGDHPEVGVVFGSRSTRTVDLGRLGTRGFRILGQRTTAVASFVHAVARLGDVGGDGAADIGLAVTSRPSGGTAAGAGFVVYGRRATATLRLDDLGSAGARLAGPAGEYVPTLTTTGNVDAGRRELLLGVPGQVLIVPFPR